MKASHGAIRLYMQHDIFKRIGIAILVRVVEAVLWLGGAVRNVSRFFLYPLLALGRGVFGVVLIRLYAWYKAAKRTMVALIPSARGFSPLRLLVGRRALQLFVIVLTIFLAGQNVVAAGRPQGGLDKSPLFSLITRGESDEEIVTESADVIQPRVASDEALRAVSVNTVGGSAADEDETVGALGDQLEKPILPETEGSKSPRDKIVKYTVLGGDTVSSIAAKFGISTSTVLWANNLSETSLIKPGQDLTILPIDGVRLVVGKGDTITSLSKKYHANADEILAYNKVASEELLNIGQELIIPGGSIETVKPPAPAPTSRSSGFASIGNIFSSGPVPPSVRAAPGNRLLWPTPSHKINQYFNWRHTGLDIDGDYSSPIYAAESGVVVRSGWFSGYGLAIIVDHGGGMQTLYGHSSKLFVQVGQRVTRGQTMAMVGSTGRSTGTHVHFEVIVNGAKRNPLSYL